MSVPNWSTNVLPMTPTEPGPTPADSPEAPSRAAIGALQALGGHALVIAAAYLAGQFTEPTPSNQFADLAAVVLVFLGGQAVLGLTCLVLSAIRFRQGRRYYGLGLLGGWLGGLALFVLIQPYG